MKYIRTKEGIFEFEKRFDLEHYRQLGYTEEHINKKFIRNGNKLADTIEELCDGFIVENRDSHEWFIMTIDEFKTETELLDHFRNWDYTAYIKTDKGLIYVAKMNEKGE